MTEVFSNKLGTIHYNQDEQVLYIEYRGTWNRNLVKELLDARLEWHRNHPVKASFVEAVFVLGSFVDCVPDVIKFYKEVDKIGNYAGTVSLISGNDQLSRQVVDALEKEINPMHLTTFTDKRRALDWMYRKIRSEIQDY